MYSTVSSRLYVFICYEMSVQLLVYCIHMCSRLVFTQWLSCSRPCSYSAWWQFCLIYIIWHCSTTTSTSWVLFSLLIPYKFIIFFAHRPTCILAPYLKHSVNTPTQQFVVHGMLKLHGVVYKAGCFGGVCSLEALVECRRHCVVTFSSRIAVSPAAADGMLDVGLLYPLSSNHTQSTVTAA